MEKEESMRRLTIGVALYPALVFAAALAIAWDAVSTLGEPVARDEMFRPAHMNAALLAISMAVSAAIATVGRGRRGVDDGIVYAIGVFLPAACIFAYSYARYLRFIEGGESELPWLVIALLLMFACAMMGAAWGRAALALKGGSGRGIGWGDLAGADRLRAGRAAIAYVAPPVIVAVVLGLTLARCEISFAWMCETAFADLAPGEAAPILDGFRGGGEGGF